MHGLIPLICEELFQETECEKTFICRYSGGIVTSVHWEVGAKRGRINEYQTGVLIKIPKEGACCGSN